MRFKIIIAALGGTLSSVILGATWYNILDSFYKTHSNRRFEDTELPLLILGLFIISWMMSILLQYYVRRGYRISTGIKIGVIIGVITGIGWGLVTYAVMKDGYDFYGTLFDSAFRIIEFGTAGAVISHILNLKRRVHY